ncbi:hypothetical protein L873DRAFT_1319943 [Choiromyces venosus 120613-1]|uniref:Uncharacterized protein n=1 Tax=Choiromyces venosus 120613-1 TaxID=1336337 RepID=A0A3N4JFE3_9PEZI|nr:hypothetical protein L873DRAFT_1319943 [Choiromyces venosus 120613-1]
MARLAGLPTCRTDHGSDWPLGITASFKVFVSKSADALATLTTGLIAPVVMVLLDRLGSKEPSPSPAEKYHIEIAEQRANLSINLALANQRVDFTITIAHQEADFTITTTNQRADLTIQIANLKVELALEKRLKSVPEATPQQEWKWASPPTHTCMEPGQATGTISGGLSTFTTSSGGGHMCQAPVG